MKTQAVVRNEVGKIIPNDWHYLSRHVEWREPDRDTSALIEVTAEASVTTWHRRLHARPTCESVKPHFPRAFCTCERERPEPEFVITRVEHVPLDLPAHLYTKKKKKAAQFKPLPFKKRFWRYYNRSLLNVLAERHYSEKDFASLPAHYRRLLRFGPMPTKREVNDVEQLLAALDQDTPREKTFDDLIKSITT